MYISLAISLYFSFRNKSTKELLKGEQRLIIFYVVDRFMIFSLNEYVVLKMLFCY